MLGYATSPGCSFAPRAAALLTLGCYSATLWADDAAMVELTQVGISSVSGHWKRRPE